MISALYNGISGLDSFQKALNVESHNIANVNTVGYKSDRINFADMMYQDRMGKGAATQSVQKDFTTGSLKLTGNSFDVAINGKGFFVVTDPTNGGTFYTKAGDFKQGVDGKLITSGENYVQGVAATVNGTMIDNDMYSKFVASKTIESDTSVETINAKATDYNKTAQSDIDPDTLRITKTASAKIADIELLMADYRTKLNNYATNQEVGTASTNQTSSSAFDDYATQLLDSNDSVSIYIDNVKLTQTFETDAATTMQLLAEKISSLQGIKDATFDEASGNLVVNTLIPGKNLVISSATINQQSYSTTDTPAVSGSGQADVQSTLAALETALESAGAQMTQVTTAVSKETLANQALNVTTLGDLQLNLTSLGVSDNQFAKPEIVNGMIYMVQGDNKYVVGRIQTAAFADEISLSPQGGNLFAATKKSGEPLDATGTSKILGNTLELSNADLGENLVNLMVYQRAYEANSKSITTSDEFLNIAIQLKK
jgi:flagellar hook protein FlgE